MIFFLEECGRFWGVWTRLALECCKHDLMGLSSRSLEDSSAESSDSIPRGFREEGDEQD